LGEARGYRIDTQIGLDRPQGRKQMQEVVIRPTKGWIGLQARELWAYRQLLYFLTWRDIKVRYKQTIFGAAWAIIQPLALMVVFTALFGRFAEAAPGAEDIPAAVFFYAGLVPWTLFASSLQGSSQSVVASAGLVTKVYFPRIIMPVAATGSFLIDFVIALLVLVGMMIFYGIAPTAAILWLPFFTLLAIVTSLAIGVALSALNAKYRDVGYAVPFITQLLFFLSPVMYPATSEFVSPSLEVLYGLNPLVGVIEGFRWALLGVGEGPGLVTLVTAVVAVVFFVGALMYFRRLERSFADVI
jgi:lipopolysaccharide transport system permease protein